MATPDTLSTAQWTALQALFARALQSPFQERQELVERARADDPALGQSLAAMLEAHELWRERTDDARGDWQRQAHASALLANGDSIGPYRILGVLGEGGMGVVYRAERADGEVTLTVAIKVLRPRALDAMAHERFRRERDLLASLGHPHIARLFDAGVSAGGHPYFVMEYVSGAGIVDWCDARRLDVRSRLRLFLDVCDAIRHAHNQLVLHRDIKPSNVLVDDAGVAKLIDFGIARPIGIDDGHVAETATANRFFSPLNVAPEQLRGERMGVACDVYQLGSLLYELLCGRPIYDFARMTARAIENAIESQVPGAPSRRVAGDVDATAMAQARGCADPKVLAHQLEGDLDGITLMALRKEPARRYASVEQLVEDIQHHLDLLPVRARGSDRGYRVSLFVRRHWRALGLAATAAIAAVAFVITLSMESRQLQFERDRALAQEHRAEEATQFLVGVFKAADPKVSLSRTTPIGEVLANGSRKLDAERTAQPQLVADLSYALAGIYVDIDAPVEAEKYARQSLALRQALDPGSLPVADSLARLAVVESDAGNCKGTLADGARALEIYRRHGVGVAGSLDVQADIVVCQAHDKGAEFGRDRMLSLLDALQHDPKATPLQVASQEQVAADFTTNLGDVKGALRLTRSAAERLDRGAWKDSAEAMQARESLADRLSEDRQFDAAGPILDRLAKDYARIYGRDSLMYANIMSERGANYYDSGHFREAEADELEALRIRNKGRQGLHADQARANLNLGSLYEFGIKDMAKAGTYYGEAARIATATLGPRDLDTLKLRASWAVWLQRVGRSKEAESELVSLRPEIPTRFWKGIEVRLALASIDLRAGKKAEAEALFAEVKAAIAADPSFSDYNEDIARIRKGEPF